MKIKLIAVGKLRKRYVKEGVADYVSRIKHYVPFEIIEVKEGKTEQYLSKDAFNVILDMRGKTFSSEEFAEFIRDKMIKGKSLAFFIGGAEGFNDSVRKKADILISFSKMTFPHELARLMLTEQIYRALTIIKGEKYHK
ncbi:MAG: 23S rRNA (pseudouridine(1915)-N(3))-methyltransferase RlmH [Caldisericaceae bacterium]|nr:23S rRNA (pseudouridine(1915)-N(3))-methyltransferase RlmH [Caldisericaceae bacterium]